VEAAVIKMIRSADYKDTKIIINLLTKFLEETSYRQAHNGRDNFENLAKLVWTVQQHGYIWLAFRDQQAVGCLLAVKQPNMWAPNCRELRELVWYILPEYRNSILGGRLFKKYCEKGEELLENGTIQGYFTTRMTTTDDINLSRRGFKLVEQTYLKEQ
jgi:N-acetylglutamate synthase-like GNAT family acetyltransferase